MTEKKEQRRKNKENLPGYWVKIRNKRTGYTKLVSKEKSLDYLYGRLDLGVRKPHLKDSYERV